MKLTARRAPALPGAHLSRSGCGSQAQPSGVTMEEYLLSKVEGLDSNPVPYRKQDRRASDQNSTFSPSCTDRGPLLWPVTVPNAPDSTLLFGAENTGVLLRLKASALN